MAMVVKNNITAEKTLGTLNKNTEALNKSLKKVSSGMRINGAADDASGFAISEKMRVQLRGLEQDFRNTQSGMSIMKVAEGAMSSTVDILRTLKEKALDSANDSNTDIDRQTMQRELERYVDQVDENAMVTYNGMYLFDGQSGIASTGVQEMIVSALYTEWIENTLDLIQQSTGLSFWDENAAIKDIKMEFVNNPGSGVLAQVNTVYTGGSRPSSMTLQVNMGYFSTLDIHDTANVSGKVPQGVLDRTIAHELTHAVMRASIDDMSNLPPSIREGMAELVHGIDDLRTLPTTISAGDLTATGAATGSSYTAGYVGLRYMAHQTGNDLQAIQRFNNVLAHKGASALDEAVTAATNGIFTTWADLANQCAADSANANFLKDYCGIDLTNDDTGAIVGYDAGTSRREINGDDIVPEGGSTTFWYAPESMTSIINNLTVHWTTDYGGKVGNKTLQIGTKANQSIKFGFHDMRAKALGLQSEDGSKVSIATQYDANNAIRLLDQSLKKALNEQTTIGALQSRLEYTAANLTTASENVQKSESTIRDADMAKEMTEYTKNSVMTQSAQAMLSQANQNLSGVLSLLQGGGGQ